MLTFLDLFFLFIHSAVVVVNVFGWVWKKTRKIALGLQLLTGFMWTVVSLLLTGGLGYCPLTDWHWQVLQKLGHQDLPSSYIKYLMDRITGMDWDLGLVQGITLGGLVFGFAMTVTLVVRDVIRKRRQAEAAQAE
jgi:hypothetical protein